MHIIDHPPEPPEELVQNGRVYSCGIYYPRQHRNHWSSEWSTAVWRCKHGNAQIIEQCAAIMARMLKVIVRDEPTIITFVPGRQTQETKIWHSRSAAESLARGAVKAIENEGGCHVSRYISLESLLKYRRLTARMQHQCTSHKQRRENVADCYKSLRPEITAGMSIVVIDDVLTSGATMRECQRVLLKAGAIDVRGLVLARTVGW